MNQCFQSREKIFHFAHKKELIKLKESKFSEMKPINVEIQPSMGCNRRCVFCNTISVFGRQSLTSKYDFLKTKDDVKLIADQLSIIGVKSVNITGGGEPLINNQTPELIHQIAKHNIDVGLVTDGDLIRKDQIVNLLNDCKWIRISVNGHNDQIFDRVNKTKKGFTHIYRIINQLAKINATLHNQNKNCTLGVDYVCFEDTVEGIPIIAKMIKEAGFDYISYKLALPPNNQNLERDTINKSTELIKKAQFEISNNFDVFSIHEERFEVCNRDEQVDFEECPMLYFFFVIRANGDIVPCTHIDFAKEGFLISNIQKNRNFSFLYSKRHIKIIKSLGRNYQKCFKGCQFDRRNRYLDLYRKGNNVKFIRTNITSDHINFI